MLLVLALVQLLFFVALHDVEEVLLLQEVLLGFEGGFTVEFLLECADEGEAVYKGLFVRVVGLDRFHVAFGLLIGICSLGTLTLVLYFHGLSGDKSLLFELLESIMRTNNIIF